MINKLKDMFKRVYKSEAEKVFFAPGRVNLIGEHTDYNGGNVFPCAITFGTYALIKKRTDKKIRFYSENFEELGIMEINIDDMKYNKEHDWANYPKGVIWVFENNGMKIDSGFDILFYGNIPNGAGLSSSASIEVVTGVVLKDLYNFDLSMIDIVKYSQKAENEYVGVNCGIMDQFAIGMGKKDKAILLDTNTLKYQYSSIKLDGASIVISNTNKRRGLADSKYNERRSECETALKDLQSELKINALCEINEDVFEKNRHLIKNEVCARRAKHAIYENQRTLKAVKALEDKDIKLFGELMNKSHVSLRDDYEVTGIELDTLVEIAWKMPGVVGSRMTGAGFGGCTVSIVKDEFVDDFIKNVGEEYKKKIGYEAVFYVAQIGDGARKL
ncbi:galactokinase [Clostridium estertheticum]|uniref:Galactokinase n=1 Tax=Clostridium estertheticum TaxID=238834 RepID=A0AA47EIL0_9CLOT|nr:galactokinase [Clostridium estertheticum]MBU3153342.1 galactokinase [Clostridium estertheticum]MBU3198452.1 galactokinase [Clostridium estertheticum]WAG60750.1 galactokinase [Clostridium estertheticum]WAG65131.1 galactokinase [Clostridium estertheticum]